MKVTQEKLPASQIGLEIEIPAEVGQQTYERVVQNLARTVNLPGFRRGKIPRPILLQRLGVQRIKAAALEELVNDCLKQAIEQESLETLGNYQLKTGFEELVQQFEPGRPLTFTAAVDVPPQVQLGDYKNLSVKAEEIVYSPSQVDDFIAERQVQQATLVPVEDRPAQMGDIAIIDYQGRRTESEAGDGIEGVEGKDFQVELEEGRFIEGFVPGIVGMNIGETQEISVTFPEDYGREDLAGEPVIFTISLKELKEKELPELDDDFAQEVSEFETMAEFRESLENQFQEKAENETKANIQEALVSELVKVSEIDLPETMVEQELQNILTQTAMQLSQYGMDINTIFTRENIPALKARSRPEAIDRLKQSLTLTQVAEQESLVPTEEEIATRYQEMLKQLEGREVDTDKLRALVTDDLQREKALDLMQEHAKVELVPEGSLAAEETGSTEAEATTTPASEATVEVEAETKTEETAQ